ncbi:MAG: hypothetical protein GX785_15175 [Armatimonadetes bacterium]|nr:hypothetical protein [Armatimonadota bacterium]HOM82860.1 hypothetical protein [Armatimonadota bacterium]HPO73656.1 hypothetical protein [Armatimonadota bacterium]
MNTLALVVTDGFAPYAGSTAIVWTEYCRRWPSEAVRVIARRFPGSRSIDGHEAS